MTPVLSVLGLAIVVVGLAGTQATPWLGWLDIAIGFVSLFVAAGVRHEGARSPLGKGGTAGLGAVLIVLGAIGLASGASQEISWWTFGIGIAFLASGAEGLPSAPRR